MLAVLARADDGSFAPSAVVPLASGGVQLEWGDDGDLLVEVGPDGGAEAWLADLNLTWQLREAADYSDLLRFIVR